MSMSTVHVLTNPAAGRGRSKVIDQVTSSIKARGCDVVDITAGNSSGDESAWGEVIQSNISAVLDEVSRLVVVGGDGLIHHAMQEVATSGIPVGVVGVGTGNDFRRGLGLPKKIEQAVDSALSDPSPVDLMAIAAEPFERSQVDDSPDANRSAGYRWAASVLTGGFSGQVNSRANTLRFPKGKHSYTVATFLELAKLETSDMSVVVDGVEHQMEASLLAVGNTRFFGGGMAICPAASPHDGLLDVVVIGDVSAFELARVLPTVFWGGHVKHKAVTVLQGSVVEIVAPFDLWADGEPIVPSRSSDLAIGGFSGRSAGSLIEPDGVKAAQSVVVSAVAEAAHVCGV